MKVKTSGELWTMQDVMAFLGCSRKTATEMLATKGCPIVPRTSKKGQYIIFADAFKTWIANGGKKS